jgi:hypothetical protein
MRFLVRRKKIFIQKALNFDAENAFNILDDGRQHGPSLQSEGIKTFSGWGGTCKLVDKNQHDRKEEE